MISMLLAAGLISEEDILRRSVSPDLVESRDALVPRVARRAGRCTSGFELGRGTIYHLVSGEVAVCGVRPGRRSAGWSDGDAGQEVTCPACRRRMP
jgi:hypothetical protein